MWLKFEKMSRKKTILMVCISLSIFWLAFMYFAPSFKSFNDQCRSSEDAWFTPRPPIIFWGMSFSFEERILEAFPVGSSEKFLIEWMDKMDFGPMEQTINESDFTSLGGQIERAWLRKKEGKTLRSRDVWRSAPITESYFSIAWNVDEVGCISEIYANTRLFHFDLP